MAAQVRRESPAKVVTLVDTSSWARGDLHELAARYNGGPLCESGDGHAYGRSFDSKLDDAKGASQ
ncbi:hypothetical protein [Streptomyces sp. NPDC055709]